MAGVSGGDECGAFGCDNGHNGCDNGPQYGQMAFVGGGQGEFMAEQSYRFIGYGGEFSNVRRRRDFTCLICTALSLLLALLAVMWCFWPSANECEIDAANWQYKWNPAKQSRCCALAGIACPLQLATTQQATAAPPAPMGPVDPFNCADGFLNWAAEWSGEKKTWCCRIHHKGCDHPAPAPANQYDCNSGLANFVKAWSMPKKQWCCLNAKTGCPGSGDLNIAQTENMGYGAGAQHGFQGAPVAPVSYR